MTCVAVLKLIIITLNMRFSFVCDNIRCDPLIKLRGIINYKNLLHLNLFELYYMRENVKLNLIVEITEPVLNLFST